MPTAPRALLPRIIALYALLSTGVVGVDASKVMQPPTNDKIVKIAKSMLHNNIMDPVQRRLRLNRLCNWTRDNSSSNLAFVAPSHHRPMSLRAREPSTIEIPIAACRFVSTSSSLDALLPPSRRHHSYSRFHSANSSNSPASFHRLQGTRASSSLSQSIQPSKTDDGCDAHDANDAITDGLNDAQREATLRPRYSITRVVAGPGAGKTWVLTRRIGHLLLGGGAGTAAALYMVITFILVWLFRRVEGRYLRHLKMDAGKARTLPGAVEGIPVMR